MERLVLDLAEVDAGFLPVVGGKAANLGELIRAGFPVPPGACVTTEAYRQVAASVAIPFDILAGARGDALQRAAAAAREAMRAAPIPAEIRRAVVTRMPGSASRRRWRCGRRPPRRTFPPPASRASRTPTFTSWAGRR